MTVLCSITVATWLLSLSTTTYIVDSRAHCDRIHGSLGGFPKAAQRVFLTNADRLREFCGERLQDCKDERRDWR